MLDKTKPLAFIARPDEPEYARLPLINAPDKNQYGDPIDLLEIDKNLAGQSLNINGDPNISDNPNRYKQHGFYFNADNCISCHACESACSEKNNLSPHLAFRAVGYIEGGSYPDYHRLNISMACNHCDNPVCLKGCPTRAYTKFAEYGAVLQDPNICFGCGYCTWVCPYNAPQLDHTKGHVEKCNMCVDRLEAGLKPACASACLAGALDFGVIETKPENRDQLQTKIPGFPTTDITHPNIRFQQTKSLPREMRRTDSMPLRYERDEQGVGEYKAKVDTRNKQRSWGLSKLRSREDPLVIFTLISQTVVGAFITLFLAPLFDMEFISRTVHPYMYNGLLIGMLGIESVALFLSTMHLGKPHRFYRAFNNLRFSPVSREVAGIAVFFNMLGAYTLVSLFGSWLPEGFVITAGKLLGWGGVISGVTALYFMHAIYRIKARPFWNHWQVLSSFYGSMLVLGSLTVSLAASLFDYFTTGTYAMAFNNIAWLCFAGLLIEATGLVFHARDMKKQQGEGGASHFVQTTKYAYTYLARNAGLVAGMLLTLTIALLEPAGLVGITLWSLAAVIMLATALVGRALFYVLVIPTTMPGAFFWRNKGFEEHARETGLAKMPQVGVLSDVH